MREPLLKVQQISKRFRMGKKNLHAVKEVSFTVRPGEILGLGGEKAAAGNRPLAK